MPNNKPKYLRENFSYQRLTPNLFLFEQLKNTLGGKVLES